MIPPENLPTAQCFFSRKSDILDQGAVGIGNGYLLRALERCGYRTRVDLVREASPLERLVPLHFARQRSARLRTSPADLAFYDDGGLSLCPPSRAWARRSVVYHHGLAFNPGTWLGNEYIDLHCCNSPYLAEVLRSLLSFPDWERRRCLDPRAFEKVASVRLPLPYLEQPDGAGGEKCLPREVQAAIAGGVVLGHALQPGKWDGVATISILFALNELAAEAGTRPVRLLVCQEDLTPECVGALDEMLTPLDRRVEDFYIPLPSLSQRSLFEVMRACAFCLAFNRWPDSLGFYVLESVCNGCPVFTNGIGNYRHLLPQGHGIEVLDDALGREDTEAYEAIARRIHSALSGAIRLGEACRRGGDFIQGHYGRDALERDLALALGSLEQQRTPVDFESLRCELSPLVVRVDLESGRVDSDLGGFALPPTHARVASQLIGATSLEIGRDQATLEIMNDLFAQGVLSLREPPMV